MDKQQINKITDLFNNYKSLVASTNKSYFEWKDAKENLFNYAMELYKSGAMNKEQFDVFMLEYLCPSQAKL